MTVDRTLFLEAMGRFPTGVTIVTTVDPQGRQWGFTASAFASLSLQPLRVLVCLDASANCHPSFSNADGFAVNILGAQQEELARHFANKMADKFSGRNFEPGGTLRLPLLPDAVASLECRTAGRLPGGDHTILLGEPVSIRLRAGSPAVFCDRQFWRLSEHPVGASAKPMP